jgi:hypothetical protein
MKKIFKAAMIILAMAVSGTGAWASSDQHLTQAQIAQFKAKHKAGYKRDKTHKVAGSAAKGTHQVSPKPVQGDH